MSTVKLDSLPIWARMISTAFHPFVMPTVTLVLLFISDGYLRSIPYVFIYMLVVVLVNTLAPALSLYLLYRRGYLSDLEIRSRRERILPFVLVLAYFALTYVLLITSPALYIPFVYLDMWMGLMASLAIALVITRWFKISMHMLGQGGALGSIMGLQALELNPNWELNAILVLIAGFVGFARIELSVHRHIEIYSGYLLGFLVCYLSVVWGLGA
jgi:hypothetical protein|tara:strand:+ start:37 stop:678 length:642 start_codon:yes stop_codon:yes gene_type:complete